MFAQIRRSIYHIYAYWFTMDIYKWIDMYLGENLQQEDTVIEIGPGPGYHLPKLEPIFVQRKIHYKAFEYDAHYSKLLKENIPTSLDSDLYLGNTGGDFLAESEKADTRFEICNSASKNVYILLIECQMLMNQQAFQKKIDSLQKYYKNTGVNLFFVFAHTEFEKKTLVGFISKYIKPLLYYVTSIDFGRPIYSDDFNQMLYDQFLNIVCVEKIAAIFGSLNIYVTQSQM